MPNWSRLEKSLIIQHSYYFLLLRNSLFFMFVFFFLLFYFFLNKSAQYCKTAKKHFTCAKERECIPKIFLYWNRNVIWRKYCFFFPTLTSTSENGQKCEAFIITKFGVKLAPHCLYRSQVDLQKLKVLFIGVAHANYF